MKCHKPLPATHPELLLVTGRGYVEYRLLKGNGRNIRQASLSAGWLDAVMLAALAIFWSMASTLQRVIILVGSIWGIYVRMTTIVHESVIIFPPHGIQLETHRGYGDIVLSVSRRFISRKILHEFVINEGLHGWNVRFYLAGIISTQPDSFTMVTAFENLLPRSAVLSIVYQGVQDHLLKEVA